MNTMQPDKELKLGEKLVEFHQLTMGDMPDIAIKLRKMRNIMDSSKDDNGNIDPLLLIAECGSDIFDVIVKSTNLSLEEVKGVSDLDLFTEILAKITEQNVNFFLGILVTGQAIVGNIHRTMGKS